MKITIKNLRFHCTKSKQKTTQNKLFGLWKKKKEIQNIDKYIGKIRNRIN